MLAILKNTHRHQNPLCLAALATALLCTLAVPALGNVPSTAPADGFAAVTHHYEQIRQALMNDSVNGVGEAARGVESAARGLASDFDPQRAGVEASADTATQTSDLLGA